MRQTENYGFNLPEKNDPVDIEILNENMIEIDNILNGLVDFFLPIGRTIITKSSTNPSETYPGTTWVQIKDRFILAAGDNYTTGSIGGSADAVVIEHEHDYSGTAASAGAHTHTVSGTAASAGAHTHTLSGTATSNGAHTHTATTSSAGAHTHTIKRRGYNDSFGVEYPSFMINKGSNYMTATFDYTWGGADGKTLIASSAGAHTHSLTTSSAGAHTHTLSGSATSNGAHTHTVSGTAASAGAHSHTVSGTTDSTGVSGQGKNMPPYITKYVWERVA